MDKGLLIRDLAMLVGVSPDTVVNWELRDVKPMGKNLERIRKVMDL